MRMAVVASGKPARTDVERMRRRRRGIERAALHAAHRPHPPDPRPPGVARPSAGRRRALRRPAGARAWSARRCMRRGSAFAHPVGGEPLAFDSPLPADFAARLGECRGGRPPELGLGAGASRYNRAHSLSMRRVRAARAERRGPSDSTRAIEPVDRTRGVQPPAEPARLARRTRRVLHDAPATAAPATRPRTSRQP